jgi:hypothetical protein
MVRAEQENWRRPSSGTAALIEEEEEEDGMERRRELRPLRALDAIIMTSYVFPR